MRGNFLRNINVLNLLLCAGVVLSVCFVLLSLQKTNAGYVPPKQGNTATNATETGEPHKTETQPALDYTIIAEQNLFHSTRKIPVEKAEAKPLPKPEFVLYGILVAEEERYAYLKDKKALYNTPGRGERLNVLKLNDMLSGFILKDIHTDSVTMVRGKEIITVSVNKSRSTAQGKSDAMSRPVFQTGHSSTLPSMPSHTPPPAGQGSQSLSKLPPPPPPLPGR